jgi:hypothetical protein
VFLEDFIKIWANICPRKLIMVANESKNIQPGNAEFTRKGMKHTNV